MPEDEVRSAMLHGKRPESDAFMHAVMTSLANEPFLRAEEQAELDTSLGKRVADTLKRAKKDASSTAGRRGREALGMTTDDKFKVPTPKTLGVSMEVVGRAYLQSFMRAPVLEGELECAMGRQCMCLKMAESFPAASAPEGKGCGFVGMQFLLPSELNTYKTHGKLPDIRKLCVICDRAATTEAIYINEARGTEPTMPLHGFCVKKDEADGYRSSMLLQPKACGTRITGVVGPTAAFCAPNLIYSKVVIDGRLVNCIIESETDFRMGSVSTQHI
jgi:hypothetical protein